MRRSMFVAAVAGLALGVSAVPAVAVEYAPDARGPWSPNRTVFAVAVTPTTVYVGGDFSQVTSGDQSVARRDLAAFDRATGALLTDWNPTVAQTAPGGERVRALAVGDDGTLFVGGGSGASSIVTDGWVVAVTPTGEVSEIATANRPVLDLAVAGDDLYAVGNFTTVDDVAQRSAARFDSATGALDETWRPQLTDGAVSAVALAGSQVLLGGSFTAVNGVARPNLAAVDTATGATAAWAPSAPGRVLDLAVSGGTVVGALGGAGGRAVAWSRTGGATRWTHRADGDAQAVSVYDGIAYVGGHFERFGGARREQLAAVTLSSGALRSMSLDTTGDFYPGVWALAAGADALQVGGSTLLAGQTAARYFALPAVPMTTVTVGTRGCSTCLVRVAQDRPGAAAYATAWRRAVNGTVRFAVPTARTTGMSLQLKAPWERRMTARSEVVMAYRGVPVGRLVTAPVARTRTAARPCYAGTGARAVTFGLQVQRVTIRKRRGTAIGSRAWVRVTQPTRLPVKTARAGVLTTGSVTVCR